MAEPTMETAAELVASVPAHPLDVLRMLAEQPDPAVRLFEQLDRIFTEATDSGLPILDVLGAIGLAETVLLQNCCGSAWRGSSLEEIEARWAALEEQARVLADRAGDDQPALYQLVTYQRATVQLVFDALYTRQRQRATAPDPEG